MPAKIKTDKTPVDFLTAKQAAAEHARLQVDIAENDQRYYQEDRPRITDAEYDALRERNTAIEARFPNLRTLDSPSRKVGVAPTGRFHKVRHAVPMLSLDNAFAEDDVVDFVDRIRRFLKLDETTIPSPPSRRSTACRCRCATKRASWSRPPPAATAREGEDVTANVRTLKDVPHQLKAVTCRRSAKCAARSI